MAVIPCTRCLSCGLWNQSTLKQCRCGADLRQCRPVMTDVSKLTIEEYGNIQDTLRIYGQICPKCQAVAFTEHPRLRNLVCPHCGSDAIAAFRPIHYLDIPEGKLPKAEAGSAAIPSAPIQRKPVPGKTAAPVQPKAAVPPKVTPKLPDLPEMPQIPKMPKL